MPRYYRTYIMGNKFGELPHFACYGMLARTHAVQQVLSGQNGRASWDSKKDRHFNGGASPGMALGGGPCRCRSDPPKHDPREAQRTFMVQCPVGVAELHGMAS